MIVYVYANELTNELFLWWIVRTHYYICRTHHFRRTPIIASGSTYYIESQQLSLSSNVV